MHMSMTTSSTKCLQEGLIYMTKPTPAVYTNTLSELFNVI